ncbi:MAG: DUF3617 family protein [Candidatus Acidiferrales bacterium]
MKITKVLIYVAALSVPIGIAMAAGTPPDVKEGLWSIHTETTDNPGNVKSESSSTICRNHAYDQYSNSLAKNVKGCSPANDSYEGGKYTMDMKCTVGGTTIESKGTVTYTGDTATHSESHSTYTPAMSGITDTTMIQDQKYIGACPAGMQPGDLKSANGNVVHLWKH